MPMWRVSVQSNALVNIANLQGNTALHEAVRGGHQPLVELLLRGGASPGLRNKRQRTPLDCAYELGGKVVYTHTNTHTHINDQLISHLNWVIFSERAVTHFFFCRTRRSWELCRKRPDFPPTPNQSNSCRCPKELWVMNITVISLVH